MFSSNSALVTSQKRGKLLPTKIVKIIMIVIFVYSPVITRKLFPFRFDWNAILKFFLCNIRNVF